MKLLIRSLNQENLNPVVPMLIMCAPTYEILSGGAVSPLAQPRVHLSGSGECKAWKCQDILER